MLLPDPQRRGEIHFLLAKSLRYEHRLAVVIAVAAAGFILQAFGQLPLGAAFLVAASLLAAVKGFSNVPTLTQTASEWRQATREQLEQVVSIARKSRTWDESAFDITCVRGGIVLLLACMVVFFAGIALWMQGYEWLATVWMLDVPALLLPQWITGVRRILTNDPLVVKIRQLLGVLDAWEAIKQPGEAFLPQMQVATGPQGEMPLDAKLVLHVERLGGDFYGLQVQVVLNRVQGSDYPYLYCVLVAKTESGLLRFDYELTAERNLALPGTVDITIETQQDPSQGVDIVVVRKDTDRANGYTTEAAECDSIFRRALSVCRQITARPQTAPAAVRKP